MGWASMPLVPLALAFAGGIALAPRVPATVAWAVWLAALGAGLALLAVGRPVPAVGALVAAVAALGALRAAPAPLPADHVAALPLPRAARLEGRLAAEPVAWAPDRARLLLDVDRVDGHPRRGRVQLTLYGPIPELAPAQPVALEARLARPTGTRNPGGFDYAAHLARQGIHVSGGARAETLAALAPPRPPWPVRVRRHAVAAVEEALPPASAALLRGLLLGDRRGLEPAAHEAFRRAGVYHVLAVSGFNVALIAGAAWAGLTLAGLGRRLTAGVAIAVVVAFALVVGPEPSVVRATIMAGLVLTALLLDRTAWVANSLGLAALLILAARPGDLLDPGFQLSFAATAGIVAVPGSRGWLAGALAVSLAAQLAVLPIGLVHFNQLTTLGVLANLAVVPLAALATVLGLAGVALSGLGPVAAAPAFDAVWPVLLALRGTVALVAAVPGAVVHLPAPPGTAVAAWAGALVLVRLAWAWREASPRRAGGGLGLGVALALLAVGLALAPLVRPPDGRLRIAVLDVGQGDAIVVEAPDGRTLLVDAGPGGPRRLDAGERVVAPYLWNRGIRRLALLVITHDDADHRGGVDAVRRLFPVDETWERAHAPGAPRWLGTLRVEVLRVPGPRGSRGNDDVLALRLDHGRASVLLASDLTAAAERALVAAGRPLAATVLKVPHHGAATSTTPALTAAVQPAVAIVSVGARNAYGHPAPGVLARLEAAGARLFRTDRDGAVLLETDGQRLTVTAWADGRAERVCLDPAPAGSTRAAPSIC